MVTDKTQYVRNRPGPVKGVTNDLLYRVLNILRRLAGEDREARMLVEEINLIIGNRLAVAARAGNPKGGPGRAPSWVAIQDAEAGIKWLRGLEAAAEYLGKTMQSLNVAVSRGGGQWATRRMFENREIEVVVRRATANETEQLNEIYARSPLDYEEQAKRAEGSYPTERRGAAKKVRMRR